MRLERLKIGTVKPSETHRFKNLKNVEIDFDEGHWVTVVIGWNGTGKSNVLEALAIIFRDLIEKKKEPLFAYQLTYRIGSGTDTRRIAIDADPDRSKDQCIIHVERDGHAATPVRFTTFTSEDAHNLPRYIFSYYSGESTRMREIFAQYARGYDKKLRSGEDPGFKRLFYALPIHSQFVLLAFQMQQNELIRGFLEKQLGIDPDEGIESVLFVIRQPPWKSNTSDGDPRFWKARGIVRDFLDRIFEIALAPVRIKRRVAISLWNKETLEFLYLYVKDVASLRHLVGDQPAAEFFRDLESSYVSELIEEVRIRVKLKKNEGSVTFRELSEGEQQLLTVLGLLRFTATEESLFLLDEPDTHLNPRWSMDYLNYLRNFVGTDSASQESSHVVFTTHNPLAIAELVKEQVQILRLRSDDDARTIVAFHPDLDPRGQGYAAIVTSEMFGIASTLDKPTQHLLEMQRIYASKNRLTRAQQVELDKLNEQLDRLGFRFFHPDDEYSRYLRLRNERLEQLFATDDPEKIASKAVAMTRDEREQLAATLIDDLSAEDGQNE